MLTKLLLAALLSCVAAFASPGTLIASSPVTNTTSNGIQTLSVSLACSGASAYFVGAAYAKGSGMTVTDSQGGTWNSNVNKPGYDPADMQAALYYSVNRAGGSITINVTSQYQSFIAFCTSNTTSPISNDLSTSATNSGCDQCQLGPFSTATDYLYVLTGGGYSAGHPTITTDNGYTMLGSNSLVGGQHYGVSVAYKFAGSAATESPSLYGFGAGGASLDGFTAGPGDGSNGSGGGGSTGVRRRVIL